MHPIFANMQSAFENMAPEQSTPESDHGAHPFARTVDSFASPDQSIGKGTTGPQQSQTVTSFSAHMKPWSDEAKPRRGKRS